MDDHPLTCTPETDVNEVRRMMLEHHVRYLPVMESRTLMGVISFYDVAKAVVEEQGFENRMLKAYIRDWPEAAGRDALSGASIRTRTTQLRRSTPFAVSLKHKDKGARESVRLFYVRTVAASGRACRCRADADDHVPLAGPAVASVSATWPSHRTWAAVFVPLVLARSLFHVLRTS